MDRKYFKNYIKQNQRDEFIVHILLDIWDSQKDNSHSKKNINAKITILCLKEFQIIIICMIIIILKNETKKEKTNKNEQLEKKINPKIKKNNIKRQCS